MAPRRLFGGRRQMRGPYRAIPAGAIRVALPNVTQQTDYSCGASCLQAVCTYYGVGPGEESQYVRRLGMDRRVGSHPDQLRRLARRLGLRCHEYQGMTVAQVRAELRRRHPVLLTLQAWGIERRGGQARPVRDYAPEWSFGHWVVAIGFDPDAIYFEDPSLPGRRGYLRDEDLLRRWHDTGRRGRKLHRYGLALWCPAVRRSLYETRADWIP